MVETHCPYCALQCAMTLEPDGVQAVEQGFPVVSGRDFPTNQGGLCRKGWTSAELLANPDRLTTPLRRVRDGHGVEAFEPVGWAEALDEVAEAWRRSRAEHGADSVAVFGSGSLTNEKAYQLGRFARLALGTSRIDYNGRFCMGSAATAANRSLGMDRGMPFPVTDLDEAHTVLLLGSNPAETMPPFVQHLSHARGHGGLLVADPRRSATAALAADGGGVHLQLRPGTDMALLLGLAHVVVDEGLCDDDYLAGRVTGLDELVRSLAPFWPEQVERTTGVPAATIRQVARRLAAQRQGTYILTGRGLEQHVDGTDCTTAAINLALLLGLAGRRGSGWGTLTGQGNGQGAREHGQKADQLPGYRSISDPAHRRHVAAVWGVDPHLLPAAGVGAVELLAELGRPDGVRCLWVNGSNIVVSAVDTTALAERLDALDLLVVSDFFFSETCGHADLVLPSLQWAEESGTMTNLEGRVLRRNPAVAAPGQARSDLWVMAELARRLDAPATWSTDDREVFDELRLASAGGRADYSGITHELLDAGEGCWWPMPATAHDLPDAQGRHGSPHVFLDRFAHPDGRARLVPVRPAAESALRPAPHRRERTGERGSLVLTTGRVLEHYQSGNQTRRVASLAAARPVAELQIHPSTAAGLGIDDGALVVVRSERASVRVPARYSTDIGLGTVFLPFHHPDEQSSNRLVDATRDPLSGMPEFKAVRVSVTPVSTAELPEEES